MKKYFFKKSFIWIFIIMIIIPFVIGIVQSSLIPITTIFRLNIDAPKISAIITRVTAPICVFLYVYSGKFFANYLNKNSEYQGDFNKYQYVFYLLANLSTYLLFAVEDLIKALTSPFVADKIGETGNIGEVFTAIALPFAISVIFSVAGLIISAKCVSSLLCAAAEGEESGKNYFSKAFLPLTLGIIIAIVLDVAMVLFLKTSIYFLIKGAAYAVLLVSMLAGLKYKFNDEKAQKLVCNILPFVYVSLSVVFAVIGLVKTV